MARKRGSLKQRGAGNVKHDAFAALQMVEGTDAGLEILYATCRSATSVQNLGRNAKPAQELIKPRVEQLLDGNQQAFGSVIRWTVATNGVYPLAAPNGTPFVVTRFTCRFDNIAWQAGAGWPVWSVRCPRNDFLPDGFFHDARAHQLVPWIKGVSYGIGCDNPAVYDFGRPGQLYVGVNDGVNDYGDNRGTFDFVVYNYS